MEQVCERARSLSRGSCGTAEGDNIHSPGQEQLALPQTWICSHEPASPWQPGTLGQAQAQLSARVGFPGEPQSPHTHRSSADGSSACATPPSGRRCREALRHRPPAGPGTSAPRAGLSRQARGEPSLAATEQALPVSAGPARCSRDRDKEVKNKPPPPRLSTSFSDFRCAGGALGASRAGSWARG